MSRETLTEIPVVSIKDYEEGNRDEFIETTMNGLHDIGFVFLETPPEVADNLPRMYKAFEKLFDLPLDVKLEFERSDIHHQRGYTPLGHELGIQCRAIGPSGEDVKNNAENWFIGPKLEDGDPRTAEFPTLYSQNVWVPQVPELEEAVEPVYDGLFDMGKKVLRALTEPLGKELHYFDDMVEGGATVFRPLHYPAIKEEEADYTIGACQHTDINLITCLPAPTREGLWVKTRAGEWIRGLAPAGHMIVQVGDMLERVTGEYFLSAQHKVESPIEQFPGDKGRYSSALFVHPRANYPLEVIPQLTDHPENFPTIGAADFLIKRLRDIGLDV